MSMQPSQAKDLIGDAMFLDVREQHEWDAGHVEGSVHIPMGEIPMRVEELDRDDEIVVVCHLGQRSGVVSDWLNERGYKTQNLDGGLAAWQAEGLPLIADGGRDS